MYESSNINKYIKEMSAVQLIGIMWVALFCLRQCCYMVSNFDYDFSDNLWNMFIVIRQFTIPLFALKIIFVDKHSVKEWAIIIAIMSIVFISQSMRGEVVFLVLSVSVISAKNISFDKIAKSYFIASSLAIVLGLLMLIMGLTKDEIWTRNAADVNEKLRHTLGFEHSNELGMICMLLVFAALVLIYKSRKKWLYLPVGAFIGLFYYFTDSRTSVYASVVATIACFMASFLEKHINNKYFKKSAFIVAILIIIVIPVLSILISLNFSPENMMLVKLNEIFTGRIELSYTAIQECGFTLFGQKACASIFIDSLYINLAVYYGLIPLAVWVAAMCIAAYRAIKYERWEVLILILATAGYSSMESYMLYKYNMVIFAVIADLFKRDRLVKEEELNYNVSLH